MEKTAEAKKEETSHVAGERDDKTHVCSECGCFFRRLDHLGRHMTTRHNESCERFMCPMEDCDTEMVRRDHLRRHIHQVHNVDPSEVLPPAPRRKPGAYRSLLGEPSKPFKCVYEDCEAEMTRKDHLFRHIKVIHKADPRQVVGHMYRNRPAYNATKPESDNPNSSSPTKMTNTPSSEGKNGDSVTEQSPISRDEGDPDPKENLPSTSPDPDAGAPSPAPDVEDEPLDTEADQDIKMEPPEEDTGADGEDSQEEFCIFCCYSFYPEGEHSEQSGSEDNFSKFIGDVLGGPLGEESTKNYLQSLKSIPVCEVCLPLVNEAVTKKFAVDEVEKKVRLRHAELLEEIGRLEREVEDWTEKVKRIQEVVKTADGDKLEGLLKMNARKEGREERNSFVLLVRDTVASVTIKLAMNEKKLHSKVGNFLSVTVKRPLPPRRKRGVRRALFEEDVEVEKEKSRENSDIDAELEEEPPAWEDDDAVSDDDFVLNDVSEDDSNEEDEEEVLSDDLEENMEPPVKKKWKKADEEENELGSEEEREEVAAEVKDLDMDVPVKVEVDSDNEEIPPPKKKKKKTPTKKVKKEPAVKQEGGTPSRPKRIKETGQFKCVFDDCDVVVSRKDHLRRHIKRVHRMDPSQVISMKKEQINRRTPVIMLAPPSLKKKKEQPEKKQTEGDHTAWQKSFKRRLIRMIQLRLRRHARNAPALAADPDLVPDPRLKCSFAYDRETDTFTIGSVPVKLLQEEGSLECGICFHRETAEPWHDPLNRSTAGRRIESHIQTAHLAVFQCPECPSILGCYTRYSEHVRGHQGKLKCTICNKQFFGEKAVLRHRWMYHMTPDEIAAALAQGQLDPRRTPSVVPAEMEPLDSKKRSHQCDTCGKCFLSRCALNVHNHTHEELEDRVCSYCGKVFKWKGSLTYHQKHICFPPGIVTPPRLPCTHCPATFKSTVALNNHLLFKHPLLSKNLVDKLPGPVENAESAASSSNSRSVVE